MGYLPRGTTAIKLLLDPNARPFVSRQQERSGATAEREGKRGKNEGDWPWSVGRAERRLMEEEEEEEEQN